METGYSPDLKSPIQFIKGVGPARAEALEAAGIKDVGDLIYYFPRRHLDRTTILPLRALKKEMTVTVVGVVQVCGERRARRRKYFQAVISDDTGLLNLLWFNGGKYISRIVKKGQRIAVHGKVEFYNGYQIVHPEFDILNDDDDPLNTGAVIPLYPLNQALKKVKIDNRGFRRLIRSVLDQVDSIPDIFPTTFINDLGLVDLNEALHSIHFATDKQALTNAVHRLKFDEHFFLQLLMALKKSRLQMAGAPAISVTGVCFQQIYEQLEFELTAAQKRVLKEIRADLGKPLAMNRLLQGDVGSGKTVVALLAAAMAVGNCRQVAVMAPTEILAHQHYQNFSRYATAARITCALLVGKQRAVERRKIIAALAAGRIDLVVGTHALIQKDVEFANLGLVVVDEQHRFGVVQRGDLVAKGLNPHFLAMTATPIPRTLAITYHGDMDLSIIDQLPADRQGVITKVVEAERLAKVYRFIRDEVDRGRQCMVVYPLVEETEKSDLAAATEAYQTLATTEFTNLNVGLLHGRMKQVEKDRVMDDFAKNKLQVLVATTVIEVGIDIPNATVMLVEHSERFGLTQLHQLRGRVGRGSDKSYCILVRRKITEPALLRLAIMERTSDGFEIADEDLKLRGPGEFYGARQSGFAKHRIANMVTDGPIIRAARKAAFQIVKDDPHLRKPEHTAVRQRFINDYQQMLDLVNIG